MRCCASCGKENQDEVKFCESCGEIVRGASRKAAPVRQPDGNAGGEGEAINPGVQEAHQKIETHSLKIILASWIFCQPLGLVASSYASQMKKKLKDGDVAGAMVASQKANQWSNIAIISGIVIIVIFLGVIWWEVAKEDKDIDAAILEVESVFDGFETAYLAAVKASEGEPVTRADMLSFSVPASSYFRYIVSADVLSCTARAIVNIGSIVDVGDFIVTTYNPDDSTFDWSTNIAAFMEE